MGRLRPEALYRPDDYKQNQVRESDVNRHEYCGVEDIKGTWERAAERIRILDPHGERARALLRQMELDS